MMAQSSLALVVSLFLFIAVLPESISGQGVIQSYKEGQRKDCVKGCRSDGIEISLNLAEDQTISFTSPSGTTVTYEKTIDPSAKNGGSNVDEWHGTAGIRAANIITRREDDGTIIYTASFVIPDHVCKLKYVNGAQGIACRHVSTSPPLMAPRRNGESLHVSEKRSNEKKSNIFAEEATSEIGTMVLWSKKAECAQSDKNEGCKVTSKTEEAMMDLVKLAISETNTAYKESGIKAELKLVHAYREPNYKEKNNGAFDKALDAITWDDEGMGIHSKREKYGADIVAFLIDDYQYCGIAWIGPGKDYMFSVTGYDCATSEYVFGHEVGHNMGCWHDRGTDNACSAFGYDYAWRDPDGDFGTVMSYGCSTGQCDNNPSDSCETIQRFSSSTLKYDGKALGDNKNDCARTHNDNRVAVAGYVDDTTTPDFCSDDPEWETTNGKDCAWVYQKFKKRCSETDGQTKAKNACPTACKNTKNCTMPKCLKNSQWEPDSGNFDNCGSIKNMGKKEKKAACKEIGADEKTFAYEACKKCKRCS